VHCVQYTLTRCTAYIHIYDNVALCGCRDGPNWLPARCLLPGTQVARRILLLDARRFSSTKSTHNEQHNSSRGFKSSFSAPLFGSNTCGSLSSVHVSVSVPSSLYLHVIREYKLFVQEIRRVIAIGLLHIWPEV
jgi:hypothetical protein